MTRTRVIAVASAKGSPGCSFVALGLAGRLAEGGVETLLVDADGEAAGSLLAVIGLLRGGDAPLLGGLGPVTVAAVEGAALAAGRGLRCLDLSGEPRALDGRQLADSCRERFGAVVADLGHQPGRLQREIVAAADWLLWVAAPDRLGFERADRVLGSGALSGISAALVLNRLGSDCLADAGAVLAERHHLPLLARLPESARAAREAARAGCPPQRSRDLRRQFTEVARCLVPDFEGRGGGDTWP